MFRDSRITCLVQQDESANSSREFHFDSFSGLEISLSHSGSNTHGHKSKKEYRLICKWIAFLWCNDPVFSVKD